MSLSDDAASGSGHNNHNLAYKVIQLRTSCVRYFFGRMLSGARNHNTGLPLDPRTSLSHLASASEFLPCHSSAWGPRVKPRLLRRLLLRVTSTTVYRLLLWMSTVWLLVELGVGDVFMRRGQKGGPEGARCVRS